MLSLIQKEVVENKKWATDEEVLDYYAVAQCTPGVIAVNTATFIGYKQKGVLGAVAATFGVVLPSLIIISIIAAVLQNFMQYEIVQHIFGGIRVAVAVLIVNAVITMGKKAIIDRLCVISISGVGYFPIRFSCFHSACSCSYRNCNYEEGRCR